MSHEFFTPIHIDNDIIAVSKAHGLHVIPDRYGKESLILINILREIYGEIIPVHRLDAGTGGLIIFARNAKAHKFLCSQFENRLVKKTYLALTKGTIHPQTLMLPIGKGNHGKFKINFKSGKPAITTFIPLTMGDKGSLIEAMPLTGRTHQIRVHLKALKAPLYDDWLYNKPQSTEGNQAELKAYEHLHSHRPNNANSEFQSAKSRSNDHWLYNKPQIDRRLTLFAQKLSFTHPSTGKNITLSAPLSPFMKERAEILGLSVENVL